MPAEENQYNFSGTYEEYFTEVFNSEFPDYTVVKESIRDGRALCFTFKKDGRTALIVEVMSQKSNAQKLRNMATVRSIVKRSFPVFMMVLLFFQWKSLHRSYCPQYKATVPLRGLICKG